MGVGDLASAVGTDSSAGAGIGAAGLASAIGTDSDANADGLLETAFAEFAHSDAAATGGILDATVANGAGEASAGDGIGDLAWIVNIGSALDKAIAGGASTTVLGNFDIATILGTGSTALAGSDLTAAGSFDLAGALGDMLTADATGANFLVDFPIDLLSVL